MEAEKRILMTCNRCGHEWFSRKQPKCCPVCKSPYYNKPRQRISDKQVAEAVDTLVNGSEKND